MDENLETQDAKIWYKAVDLNEPKSEIWIEMGSERGVGEGVGEGEGAQFYKTLKLKILCKLQYQKSVSWIKQHQCLNLTHKVRIKKTHKKRKGKKRK